MVKAKKSQHRRLVSCFHLMCRFVQVGCFYYIVKEIQMTHKNIIQIAPPPSEVESTRHIEEAAYYSWLNRGRYAQPGDELNDWIEAEKQVLDSLKETRTNL